MGEDNAVKKKILFKAPMLTQSGYGVHSRQVARYLVELAEKNLIDLYCEPVRWGDTTWALDGSYHDGLIKKLQRYFKPVIDQDNKRMKFDVSIQLILPNEWTPSDARFNIGMTAGVETDKCSEKWVECCNKMDMIIVPSSFTAQLLKNSGELRTPIHVVPEAFFDGLLNSTEDLNFGFETQFNFLIVSQLTANHSGLDRKNIFSTVKCICETFPNNEDVGVVIKTNSGRCTKIDRIATTEKFKQMIKLARKDKQFPKIHILHGEMSDKEMVALYNDRSIKAFVSLTRGEGYGLPILEAAVAGLPVIATDWSGHLDFMNKGKFIKVGYELQVIPEPKVDGNIWVSGARWANPSEANAKAAFKKFYQSPEIPKQWATDLSKTLKAEYCYESVRNLYHELLSNVIL